VGGIVQIGGWEFCDKGYGQSDEKNGGDKEKKNWVVRDFPQKLKKQGRGK